MKKLTYILIAALAILHHDFWLWNKPEPLYLGFLPPGLAYHMAYSLAVAGVWAMAVRYAWPADIERLADEFEPASQPSART